MDSFQRKKWKTDFSSVSIVERFDGMFRDAISLFDSVLKKGLIGGRFRYMGYVALPHGASFRFASRRLISAFQHFKSLLRVPVMR